MRLAFLVLAAGLIASLAGAQTIKRPRFLGEISHLNTDWDPRKSIKAGRATIHQGDPDAVIDGRDDAGRRWSFTLPIYAGVGWTDLWQGDFDGNSRADLMIARVFPKSGRCLDGAVLTFVMFDRAGRPVPWTVETHFPRNSEGQMPALFVPSPNRRRLDLVATGCEYSPGPVAGEDRSITGIFEAEDAYWRLIRPANLDSYEANLRAEYPGKFVTVVKSDPAEWPDAGNVPRASAGVREISDVLEPNPTCPVIRIPIANGALQRSTEDECDVERHKRLRLSDGTVCVGWPTLIIDSASGREIVDSLSTSIQAKLAEVAKERLPVRLTGQTDPERCSPTSIWADRASQ